MFEQDSCVLLSWMLNTVKNKTFKIKLKKTFKNDLLLFNSLMDVVAGNHDNQQQMRILTSDRVK